MWYLLAIRKVLIAVSALCILAFTGTSNASHNSSVASFYDNSNQNVTHQYAIINDTKHVLATISKLTSQDFQLRAAVKASSTTRDKTGGTMHARAEEFEKYLERSSVIYGLTKMANVSNVNSACFIDLKQIKWGILRKEPWAMKVLDASGTKPSGFVYGQNYWLGSKEACDSVNTPVRITLSKEYDRIMHFALITEKAPFDVNYRVIFLHHRSPWQVEIKLMSEQMIHIGLCLPSACDTNTVQSLMNAYIESDLFVDNQLYDIHPEVIYMKDMQLTSNFYDRFSLKFLCALAALTVIAMCAAALIREKSALEVEKLTSKQANGFVPTGTTVVGAKKPIAPTVDEKSLNDRLKEFVLCFDLIENCEKLFATKDVGAGGIPIINGIRSVSAVWLLAFHVVWFMYFTVNNKIFLMSLAENLFLQALSSAAMLVDVFFAISGFLQAGNFLRNKKQREEICRNNFTRNVKLFSRLLLHRCLRIVPFYLVTILLVDLFFAYIADKSVFHLNEPFDKLCAEHWWRNAFFIQNLFSHEEMCANWSWSLACDMQFFLVTNLLLFLYAKHPKFVQRLVCLLFVAQVLWTYNTGVAANFQLSFDSVFHTGSKIYTSPFVRSMPYIMGAITGWYFYEKKNGSLEVNEAKQRALWNLSILLFFTCMNCTVKRDFSPFWCTTIYVFGRFIFALCACWMIVGSAIGSNCWWSRILEAKCFQHWNKLSYGIYLINPLVITFFFSLTDASTHASPFMLVVFFPGFAVLVYLLTIVLWLTTEIPYCNWSSILQRRNKAKSA